MSKPKVFISSTIYDFRDLRSSIKYWLEDAGYDVQLSEQCDFAKDSSKNSYDACLDAIHDCDYFILLIGNRVGGMFDSHISITRKEYKTAYALAMSGSLKRIITFVRQSIIDVLEDRKALENHLAALDIFENGARYNKDNVAYHDSKIIEGAKHIKSFIDEVTRKAEFKANEKPSFNWINSFVDFSDIISVLKNEMRLDVNISRQIAEQSLKSALINNLQELTSKTENEMIFSYCLGFKDIRPKLIKAKDGFNDVDSLFNMLIELPSDDVLYLSNMFLFFRQGVNELESYTFEQAISSGAFLEYNREKMLYTSNNIIRALYEMIREIKRLKISVTEFPNDSYSRMINTIKNKWKGSSHSCSFLWADLAHLNSIYERQYNIIELSIYLLKYIACHDNIDDFPILLKGFIKSERPAEEDIINTFYKKKT